MPMIDLGTPPPPPVDLLDALPRRLALTLPELRLAAERAGGAPLPFDLVDGVRPGAGGVEPGAAGAGGGLEGRLGRSRGSAEDAAYARALGAVHDPAGSLVRRGLLAEERAGGELDPGLAGALGLLATPELALDADVAVGTVHARSWQRQAGGAVAALSTVDGVVFELAWFHPSRWVDELSRVAVLPEDVTRQESGVPRRMRVPFELADAAGEALRGGREDLLPVLVARHHARSAGPADAGTDGLGADGDGWTEADLAAALTALQAEARGRLRVLTADLRGGGAAVVGVVSWTLVADGWRALRPHDVDGVLQVEVRAVGPADLAGELAPVLAEVVTGSGA